MAYKGKTMRNVKTGMETRFLQTAADTAGALLEMETTYPARSQEPPPHYHPEQDEDFIIQSGAMTARIEGQLRVLQAGDVLHIPAGQVHSMWNHTDTPSVVNWKVRPALDSEYFFETTTGLANDGQTNEAGVPGIFQAALLMRRYARVFRLAKPPYPIQWLVFGLLAVPGRISGLGKTWERYAERRE
jgi:quercetin dioxygenase-like cupin family protein